MANPLEIQMALHFWTRPTAYAEHEPEHRNSGAVKAILAWYVRDGFLEVIPVNEHGETYRATEALGVWVKALCAVPFPVQKWVIPTVAHSSQQGNTP